MDDVAEEKDVVRQVRPVLLSRPWAVVHPGYRLLQPFRLHLWMKHMKLSGAELMGGANPAKALSPRERQVVGLVALGHTNVEIGRGLGISHRTVETHRKHIRTKLGLEARAELVRFALEHGLMSHV